MKDKFLQVPGNVRGLITTALLVMFVSVLMTFIANPSALNPEKNQAINIIIGVLISELKNCIAFYFNQKIEEKEENDNQRGI